jgi:hypothetical protein
MLSNDADAMSISGERLKLILTRARLMSMLKRSVGRKDYAMRNLHEGDVVSCWTDGDLVKPSSFRGGHRQLFFIAYSNRHDRYMGFSPEFNWICTPVEFFADRCMVTGDVYEQADQYEKYLSDPDSFSQVPQLSK